MEEGSTQKGTQGSLRVQRAYQDRFHCHSKAAFVLQGTERAPTAPHVRPEMFRGTRGRLLHTMGHEEGPNAR